MTILGMVATIVISFIVVGGAFYWGKLLGYMKGTQHMLSWFADNMAGVTAKIVDNLDIPSMVKQHFAEWMDAENK